MTSRRQIPVPAARLRCAIYTRKSLEEGLEQSFNSLDAQREACEAYVQSQVGEGWSAIPTLYDDGGYSGGTMERPGLRQLLADIALRKVDIVVVYKVDRLTRSLADFAKIVEIFDGHGVSFVSVTQAFNTTSSMGRLTLNVLLSFAQFEREVTGERIRDKIAASKKRGMWMGGTPPIGYRGHERTLVIDEGEAATVRHIFERYLELRSVRALHAELGESQTCSRPSRRTGDASVPFSRGALYHLLSNRIYLGEIVHKGESYPGLHPAIIDRETYDKVEAMLAANRNERGPHTATAGRAPLAGLIFDAEGRPLTPIAARNGNDRIYRYYVSSAVQRGGKPGPDTIRVQAPAIEKLVLDRLLLVLPSANDWVSTRQQLIRIEVASDQITILLKPSGRPRLKMIEAPDHAVLLESGEVRVTVPSELRRWGGRTEIARPDRQRGLSQIRIDRSLVRGLGRAHAIVAAAKAATDRTIGEIGRGQRATESYVRRLARLAFLAPDIQEAILEGRQPMDVSLERLMRINLPMSWSAQRQLLGFRSRSR